MEPNIHRRKLIREFWIIFTMFVNQKLKIHNFHCGTFHSVRVYENEYVHLDTENREFGYAYAVNMHILAPDGPSITKLAVMAYLRSRSIYDPCLTITYRDGDDEERFINIHPEKLSTETLEEILKYMKDFNGYTNCSCCPLISKRPVFI